MGPAKLLDKFDSNNFWDTVRKWSKNNLVFVSEEKAPSDFVAVWSKVYNRTARSGKSGGYIKTIDKLFIHKSYIKK
jgi:DNA adenine methylase